ncbi:MAG TPA: hypothetical protein VGY66_33915, partial [Gemmataceae bacterium]|nr:hypothetical protein [Gemmataceae bacterium]
VSATSKPSITSYAIAGGGAAGLGLAASIVQATIGTTTDAHFSHGANVSAGGGITAQAQFVPTTNIVAGGIAGGFLGIGASDAEATLASNTNGSAQTGAILSAGQAVTIESTSNVGSLTVNSFQGTLGGVAVNAAVAQVDSANNASASLASGAAVTSAAAVDVIAITLSAPVAHAYGLSAGAYALGATSATASETGTTRASIDSAQIGGSAPGQQVGSVAVVATTSAPVEADSWAAAAGIGAGSINFASATAEPTVQAYIGNQTTILVSAVVTLNADAKTGATTNVFGLSIGLLTAGLCQSNATDAPGVTTYIGPGSGVNAGGDIGLESSHNLFGGTGAKATAEAPGVALAGYAGADPAATADASVNSYVSPGASIQTNGNITIGSDSNNYANAEADSIIGGILGAGTSTATATVQATTGALMNGTVTSGNNLVILAQSSNVGRAEGGAVSAGLINGAGVITTTNVSPTIQASIGDGNNAASVLVGGDVNVTSQAVDSAAADANSVVGGIGLGLGIANASVNLSPTVATFISQNSNVTSAGGSVTLQALHNYKPDGSLIGGEGAQASAGASGGGAISVQNTTATTTANANVQTHVDAGATINAANNVVMQSYSDNTANGSADSFSGGLFAGVGGVAETAFANGTTSAYLGGINGLTAGGNLTILAQGSNSTSSFAQAAGAGVVSLDGSQASAADSPDVLAALSSNHLVSVGGTATVEGLVLGNASADAEGETSSFASVGTSKASASWSPTIEANIGAGTVLQAGGDVKVLAFDNYNEAGNVDKTRQAYATATATPLGLASLEAADISLSTNSNVNAHIGAGASISAAYNLEVNAQAFNQVGGAVTGGGVGLLISYGSTNAQADMTSRTLAGTDDASGSAPTVLRAGQLVQILSVTNNVGNVNATGSGGGLIGLGGLQIDLFLNNPLIQSRLGNNTAIDASNAFVWVGALNQNHLTVNGSQTTVGAIVNNEADANASAKNSQTLADIGSNVQVNAAAFLLSAADTVESSASSYAYVPEELTGNNTADSEADENTNSRVHIGSGSSITAAAWLNISASAEQATTNSKAKTHTGPGIAGNLFSFAGSNKNVNSEVDTDPGSSLTAASVTITAARPQTGGNTYIRDAETDDQTLTSPVAAATNEVCSVIGDIFGNSVESGCTQVTNYVNEIIGAGQEVVQTGAESVTNSVNLNSDITILGQTQPTLVVDSTGRIVQADGIAVTDGANPVNVGQTVTTNTIVVDHLLNVPSSQSNFLRIDASGGSTSGFSNLEVDAFDTIAIENDSTKNLELRELDTYDPASPPQLRVTANQGSANWTHHTTTQAISGSVHISNTNPASGDITLLAPIINPAGATVIEDAGGNILAAGPGAYIQTRLLSLEADKGSLGTSGQPLPVDLRISQGLPAGIQQAQGSQGVFLNVTPSANLGTSLQFDVG